MNQKKIYMSISIVEEETARVICIYLCTCTDCVPHLMHVIWEKNAG